MNCQEIFDKAYLGLRLQGRKGTTISGGCAYNGQEESHCGVGHLVTPEIGAIWDRCGDTSIDSILQNYREAVSDGEDPIAGVEPWMLENQGLLDKIQEAHDGLGENPEDWYDPEDGFEAAFQNLATAEKLVIPA